MRAKELSQATLLSLLVLSVGALAADKPWKTTPPAKWTVEEALQVLTNSPWAKEKHFALPRVRARAGTTIALSGGGHRSLQRRLPQDLPGLSEPPLSPADFGQAAYLVRWESARPVADAFARLEELGQTASARFQAPPPRRPADRYVITVKTTRPATNHSDLFDGLDERELKQRARLATSRGRLTPLEVERSGVGASAAVHFLFAREWKNQPLLSEQREKVEFRFQGKRFTLKHKFTLESDSL
ncbi:MAG: hypothetical protein ACE5HB_05565, partial [Terriglobia bacterium]